MPHVGNDTALLRSIEVGSRDYMLCACDRTVEYNDYHHISTIKNIDTIDQMGKRYMYILHVSHMTLILYTGVGLGVCLCM